MATVTWVNNADGAWNTGSNWSAGIVPGLLDDVTISTTSPHTVTFSGTSDTVSTLYVATSDKLVVSGSTLTVNSYGTLYGGVSMTGGGLTFAGSGSYLGGVFTQTAGRLAVTSGMLTLAGTGDVLGGVVTGAGALDFSYGTYSLASGVSLSVGSLIVDYGSVVTLGADLTDASGFATESGGTLVLGTHTLGLSGSVALDGGLITGAGTAALSGSTEIYNLYLGGPAVAINTGTVDQANRLQLGTLSADSSQFINAAGGVYRMLSGANIYASGTNDLFTNAGTLLVTGSSANGIAANFVSTGSISLTGIDLQLSGTADTLGGTITGGGLLDLYYAGVTLAAGLSLGTAGVLVRGGSVTLGGNLAYAGAVAQTSGTIALAGKTLTLSGVENLDGGQVGGSGSLALTGTTELNAYYLAGSAAMSNAGTVDQTGLFYDGYTTGDTARATNLAGATWRLESGADISATVADSFTNSGTMVVTAGVSTSTIAAKFSNTGLISVNSGTLQFTGSGNNLTGTIAGAGRLDLYNGSTTLARLLVLSVANVLIDYNSVVTLGGGVLYTGSFAQNAGTLAMGGKYLNLNGDAAFEGGVITGAGTVTVGSNTELAGNYVEGSVLFRNFRQLTQTASVHLGYNSGDTAQILNIAGAHWTMLGGSTIYGITGSTITNQGTWAVSGSGASNIGAAMTSTGLIDIRSGTLQFSAAGSDFSGSITDVGTLDLYQGTDKFEAGLSLTVGALVLDYGANLTVGGSLAYAGTFTQNNGTLALAGNTLTLSGPANLFAGIAIGAGTIALTGSTDLGNYALEGTTALTNAGALRQAQYWRIGYNAGDTPSATNLAAGTWDIQDGAYMYGTAGSTFKNAGLLRASSSGTESIQVTFANTGTVLVNDSILQLTGTGNSLAGKIGGGGTLDLNSGSNTVASGVSLTVGTVIVDSSTVVTLAGNLAYAGNWDQVSGTVSIGSGTLALSGNVELDGGAVVGGGSVTSSGTGEISSYFVEGSTKLTNTGVMNQTGYWYLGYNSGDTAKFTNAAGATFRIEYGSRIYGTAGSSFVNSGTVVDSGTGVSSVAVAFINSGNVQVGSRDMQFQGAVSGTGTLGVGAGGVLEFQAVVSGGSIAMAAGSTLYLDQPTSFAAKITQFVAGDLIHVGGFGFGGSTSYSFNSGTDQITVTNGSSTAVIGFVGAHAATDFRAFNDHGIFGIAHT